MANPTSDQVLLLIGEPAGSADVTAQINAAVLIVVEDLAGSGLSEERKDLIALYLAAHFATLTLQNGGLLTYKVGESTERYAGTGDVSAQGYLSTRWGQTAIALDTTGTLAQNAAATQKAEFRVV